MVGPFGEVGERILTYSAMFSKNSVGEKGEEFKVI
jgi:hypothetical protein